MGRRARPRALRLARRASLVVVDAPVPRPTSTPTPFPRPPLSPRLAPRAAPQVDAAEDTYRRLNVRVKREVERGEICRGEDAARGLSQLGQLGGVIGGVQEGRNRD